MQTTITQAGPADYELDLSAPAGELAPRLDAALRKQRGRVQLRGFRPGKAPVDLVRKMYGQSLAYEIAETLVQEAFDREVAGNPSYRLIGRPALTRMDYDGTGDLAATIRFGVRPEITLAPLAGTKLTRLAHEVTDVEIEAEIERLRTRLATEEPAPEGHALAPTDAATIDLRPLDAETNLPLAEGGEQDAAIILDDPNLQTPLRDALIGKTAGSTFRVELGHDDAHGEHEGAHTHAFEVTVKQARTRTVPEADDAFATRISKERFHAMDDLRADIRRDVEASWEKRQRDYLESQFIETLVGQNPVPVPQSAVDLFLDSFVASVAERSEGKLPEDFDEAGFRENSRDEAERQARWMLIRDALVERYALTVETEDLDGYFATQATEGIEPAFLRKFYEASPRVMEQLEQRLLSEKLFARLADEVAFEDRSFEDVQADLTARRG